MFKIFLCLYFLGVIINFIVFVFYYRIEFASEIIELIYGDFYTTNPVIALLGSLIASFCYPLFLLIGIIRLILIVLYLTLYIPASWLFNLED